MNIKVNYQASTIYDILAMPRYVYLKEGKHASWKKFEDKINEQITSPEYKAMIHTLNEKLDPFFETIQLYYVDEFLSSYDFFNLLMNAYSIEEYSDVLSYLAFVYKDEDFRTKIFKSLSQVDDDQSEVDLALLDDALALLNYVKALPTEMAYKWQLLTLFQSPKAYLKGYIDLIKSIIPIYQSLSEPKEALIKTVGSQLETLLNNPNSDAFSTITKNLISPSLTNHAKTIYISVAYPYSFILNESVSGIAMIWGLYMEEGFKMIKESIDDETSNRVQIFKNLGDKTRYDVLKLIARGITSTKTIAENLHVSSATISYHISALVTANMITLSDDKKKKYDVNKEALTSVWKAFINDLEEKPVKI